MDMEYTRLFNELKLLYSPVNAETLIPGSEIKIYNTEFRSELLSGDFLNVNDKLISENYLFSYPVFTPQNRSSKKVILLLHGLNERSWVKYLAWAYWLASKTDSYVILFPISFHINRSPGSWSDPRTMMDLMKERKSTLGEVKMSSFANAALSKRLSEDPMRFFNSGYQTVSDIVKLLSSIKKGDHPIIPKSTSFNIFAYSIGAFLAEIIMMGNPEKLFSESKLFIFCGGSVFSNMQGTSKLIMDNIAYQRVYDFYLNDFENSIADKKSLSEILKFNQIGMAFRSMIDFSILKSFRENILRKLNRQIHTITLQKDTVIPERGVVATLSKWNTAVCKMVEVWDFPYAYSHENPFPVFNSPLSKQVDQSFERVFTEACVYLA
jgi:hypothetical protein